MSKYKYTEGSNINLTKQDINYGLYLYIMNDGNEYIFKRKSPNEYILNNDTIMNNEKVYLFFSNFKNKQKCPMCNL